MKLKIGNNDIFDCPEGPFRGRLERVGEPKKLMNKPCSSQVRFTFRVKTELGKEHLVARTFCADLSYGSELHSFLDSWLGEQMKELADAVGELDLNLLVGKDADLSIKHGPNVKGHDKPFVNIAGIFPPGTLIKD